MDAYTHVFENKDDFKQYAQFEAGVSASLHVQYGADASSETKGLSKASSSYKGTLDSSTSVDWGNDSKEHSQSSTHTARRSIKVPQPGAYHSNFLRSKSSPLPVARRFPRKNG